MSTTAISTNAAAATNVPTASSTTTLIDISTLRQIKNVMDALNASKNEVWQSLLAEKSRKKSALSIFREEKMKELQASNESMTKKELAKSCNQLWKDFANKEVYHKLAKEENSLKKTKKSLRAKKVNMYNMYLTEQMKLIDDKKNIGDVMKSMGQKWKSLSKEEQEKYKVLAAEHNSKLQTESLTDAEGLSEVSKDDQSEQISDSDESEETEAEAGETVAVQQAVVTSVPEKKRKLVTSSTTVKKVKN